MYNRAFLAIVMFMALSAAVAHAASNNGGVEFSGVMASSYSFSDIHNGTLELDGDLRAWRTTKPATVVVTHSGGIDDIVRTSAGRWETYPTKAPGSSFMFSGSVTSGPNMNSPFEHPEAINVALPRPGVDTLSIELTIEAREPGPFPSGSYVAEATLFCGPENF